jgi:GrpB-like predicted nucleotidyltransferase (UPF0157 family)
MMPDEAISLIDHDATWATRFAKQQVRLSELFGPLLVGSIEHVGSTAVPGLRAKPIVDLLAPVTSLAVARHAIPRLTEGGWLFWPDDPNGSYRLWFLRPRPDARTHHLQIIAHDHPAARALIVFRDALLEDPALRDAYAALKGQLAARHRNDRDAYTNAKADFVRAVLRAKGAAEPPRRAL